MSASEVVEEKTEKLKELEVQTSKMVPPLAHPGFFSFMSPHSRRFRDVVLFTTIAILLIIWMDYSFNYSHRYAAKKAIRFYKPLTHNEKNPTNLNMRHLETHAIKDSNRPTFSKFDPKMDPDDDDDNETDDKDDESPLPMKPPLSNNKPCICPPPISPNSIQTNKNGTNSRFKDLAKTELPTDLMIALGNLNLEEINSVTQVLRTQLVKMKKISSASSGSAHELDSDGAIIKQSGPNVATINKSEIGKISRKSEQEEISRKDNVGNVQMQKSRISMTRQNNGDNLDQNVNQNKDLDSKPKLNSDLSKTREKKVETEKESNVDKAPQRLKSEVTTDDEDKEKSKNTTTNTITTLLENRIGGVLKSVGIVNSQPENRSHSENEKASEGITSNKIISTTNDANVSSTSGQSENKTAFKESVIPVISRAENSEKAKDAGRQNRSNKDENEIDGLAKDKTKTEESHSSIKARKRIGSMDSAPKKDIDDSPDKEPEEIPFGVDKNYSSSKKQVSDENDKRVVDRKKISNPQPAEENEDKDEDVPKENDKNSDSYDGKLLIRQLEKPSPLRQPPMLKDHNRIHKIEKHVLDEEEPPRGIKKLKLKNPNPVGSEDDETS